jgi:uncharacterized protein (TIGR02647 family)
MPFTSKQLEELKVLGHYSQPTSMVGIKIHHTADPEAIEAAKRLHDKGLVDQVDGGYLTDLGCEAVEKLHGLLTILVDK